MKKNWSKKLKGSQSINVSVQKSGSLLILQLVHLAQNKMKSPCFAVSWIIHYYSRCSVFCVYIFFSLSPLCHQCIFFSMIFISIWQWKSSWSNDEKMGQLLWMITNTWTNKRELNMNEDEQQLKMCKRTFSLLTITITNHLHKKN